MYNFKTILTCLAVVFSGLAYSDLAASDTDVEVLDEIIDVTEARHLNPNNYSVMDRAINVLTAKTARPGSILLLFDHRVRQSLSDDPFDDLLGFDGGGLKVGLGIRYGVMDNIDIGMYRLNGTVELFDTYEFDGRLRLLTQENHGFDLAARAGITWFSQKSTDDASGFLGQMLVDGMLGERVTVGSGVLYHSESSNGDKSDLDANHSLALSGYVELRFSPTLAWVTEGVASVDGYSSDHPVLSTAIKIRTHRHVFSIMVTNSQYITADGVITNTETSLSDIALGFTIIRELDL